MNLHPTDDTPKTNHCSTAIHFSLLCSLLSKTKLFVFHGLLAASLASATQLFFPLLRSLTFLLSKTTKAKMPNFCSSLYAFLK